jgi:type I restriction enzyme M protein
VLLRNTFLAEGLIFTVVWSLKILEANFKVYLDGFSDDVKEIIEKFDRRNQIHKMSQADVLLDVLEKFTSPLINLSPEEVTNPDGRKLAGLSNLGMGFVFEELIRRFNEQYFGQFINEAVRLVGRYFDLIGCRLKS